MTLVNDTINANYAFYGGGIEVNFGELGSTSGGKLAIQNTIIAQNTLGSQGAGPDVLTLSSYMVTDDGGNLVGNDSGSSGFNPGALIGTPANPINPRLGPLLDDGSEAPYTLFFVGTSPAMYEAGAPASLQVVETEALATTSPAFAAGILMGSPSTDERGFARVATRPSIGAYQPEYLSTATRAQVYAENLYEILLDRPGDGGGVAFWASRVSASGGNGGVIQTFETTPEYRTDQIDLFYEAYLNRSADGGGVSYWMNLLNAGGTLAQVQAMFLGSGEFSNNHGGNAVTVLEGTYENLLDRVPMTIEVDQWARTIQFGATMNAVAYDFVVSSEDDSDLVAADYVGLLGRAAAAYEVNFWVGMVSNSPDPKDLLIASILGSSEAFGDRA